MQSVGFIGLGNVGGKLAGSLLRNKCRLMVRDLDQTVAQPFIDAGASWADSPKMMAEQCEIIITCLPSPAASAAAFLYMTVQRIITPIQATADKPAIKRRVAVIQHRLCRACPDNILGRFRPKGLRVVQSMIGYIAKRLLHDRSLS